MADDTTEAAAAKAAPSVKDTEKETLIGGERILGRFHPHPVSFARWYAPSVLLFVWTGVYLIILAFFASFFDGFRQMLGNAGDIAPLLFWAIGALLIGFIMPRDARTAHDNVTASTFLKGIHYLYIALLLVPFIMYFIIRAGGQPVQLSPWVEIYALLLSVLMVLIYDLYRRSFTYFVTNFRVIFRYKFIKTAENNLRFSQIRDVEIDRTFLQRIFKLGNVRPYTGAEENLVDLTPGYDSPDECFFGVRNPEYVKRLILEQMLGPSDAMHASVYGTGPQAATGAALGAPLGAPSGTPPPPPGAAGSDGDRVRRLEQELDQLRREKSGGSGTPATRTAAPGASSAAFAKTTSLPPAKGGKLSDITPTVGVRDTEKSHAEFGDDRDSFASSSEDFRGAKKPERKPAPSGTEADEGDKPRGI